MLRITDALIGILELLAGHRDRTGMIMEDRMRLEVDMEEYSAHII